MQILRLQFVPPKIVLLKSCLRISPSFQHRIYLAIDSPQRRASTALALCPLQRGRAAGGLCRNVLDLLGGVGAGTRRPLPSPGPPVGDAVLPGMGFLPRGQGTDVPPALRVPKATSPVPTPKAGASAFVRVRGVSPSASKWRQRDKRHCRRPARITFI